MLAIGNNPKEDDDETEKPPSSGYADVSDVHAYVEHIRRSD